MYSCVYCNWYCQPAKTLWQSTFSTQQKIQYNSKLISAILPMRLRNLTVEFLLGKRFSVNHRLPKRNDVTRILYTVFQVVQIKEYLSLSVFTLQIRDGNHLGVDNFMFYGVDNITSNIFHSSHLVFLNVKDWLFFRRI